MAYALGIRGRLNMPREFMNRQEMEMARQLRPDLLGFGEANAFCQLPTYGQIIVALAIFGVGLAGGAVATMALVEAAEEQAWRT